MVARPPCRRRRSPGVDRDLQPLRRQHRDHVRRQPVRARSSGARGSRNTQRRGVIGCSSPRRRAACWGTPRRAASARSRPTTRPSNRASTAAPDAVGRGIGTLLYRSLFELIAGEDVRQIVAGVTLPNPASIALHERLGFRPVGVFSSVGRKFDRYWDVAWFERPLKLELSRRRCSGGARQSRRPARRRGVGRQEERHGDIARRRPRQWARRCVRAGSPPCSPPRAPDGDRHSREQGPHTPGRAPLSAPCATRRLRVAPSAMRTPISLVRRATGVGQQPVQADRRQRGAERPEQPGQHRHHSFQDEGRVDLIGQGRHLSVRTVFSTSSTARRTCGATAVGFTSVRSANRVWMRPSWNALR